MMYAFLRSLAMIALFRMAGEMLLPEGKLRDLCGALLGLTAMICMLSALKGCLSVG